MFLNRRRRPFKECETTHGIKTEVNVCVKTKIQPNQFCNSDKAGLIIDHCYGKGYFGVYQSGTRMSMSIVTRVSIVCVHAAIKTMYIVHLQHSTKYA